MIGAVALLLLGLPGSPAPAASAGEVGYTLEAGPAGPEDRVARIRVVMDLPPDVPAGPLSLIMPRAIPMGYGQQPYDEFVTIVGARSRAGGAARVERDDGPRWSIRPGEAGERLGVIEYDVDLAAMEATVLAGGDSSRSREGYLSLLGYSVYSYIDGLEDRAVKLTLKAPSDHRDWPVFSTLAPASPAASGPLSARATDFYALADSQVLMGTGFQLRKLKASPDLFLALRAEGPGDLDAMAPLAEQAYEAVIRYFGSAPFDHYTMIFEYLKPVSLRHTYGFSMEHLESATFVADATAALTAGATETARAGFRYNVAHHVSHAWIPKRCAGEGYFPFRFELPPLLDTVWFAEGFGQYAAADALSDVLPAAAGESSYRERLVELRFRAPLGRMPAFLKRMPLVDLSRVASTIYSEDFRTGRTVFSRGGLMAYEMDEEIRASSRGTRRFRDAVRGLMEWSAREKRPFRIAEIPAIFRSATGVDTTEIMERWLRGMESSTDPGRD